MDEYLFGPTGAGNPNISGFYFDDHWTIHGPSEMDGHAAADMGLSPADLSDLMTAFNWVQAKAYSEILKRGKFSWNQFWNGGGGTDPGPERTVSETSAAWLAFARIRALSRSRAHRRQQGALASPVRSNAHNALRCDRHGLTVRTLWSGLPTRI